MTETTMIVADAYMSGPGPALGMAPDSHLKVESPTPRHTGPLNQDLSASPPGPTAIPRDPTIFRPPTMQSYHGDFYYALPPEKESDLGWTFEFRLDEDTSKPSLELDALSGTDTPVHDLRKLYFERFQEARKLKEEQARQEKERLERARMQQQQQQDAGGSTSATSPSALAEPGQQQQPQHEEQDGPSTPPKQPNPYATVVLATPVAHRSAAVWANLTQKADDINKFMTSDARGR